MRFPVVKGNIIAFDLDNKDSPDAVLEQVKIFKVLLNSYNIEPLIYHSGSKGFHIEIRTKEKISQNKLAIVSKYLAEIAKQQGINCIDRIYPYHKSAYKLFGTKHLKTGNFTKIFADNTFIDNKETCWLYFNQYKDKYSIDTAVIDKIVNGVKPLSTKENHIKDTKKVPSSTANTRRGSSFKVSSIDLLIELYHNGLQTCNTRHDVSFHLGRLFRHWYGMSKKQAVTVITKWLKEHFTGQFKRECLSADATFENRIDDTVNEVLRAYTKQGFPFEQLPIQINFDNTNAYINSLPIKHKFIPAILYIVNKCNDYKKLVFYHSYKQFGAGWNLVNKRSIKQWIDTLVDSGLLTLISQGSNLTKKSNLYKLNLPDNCYSEIQIKTLLDNVA